jgi:hypothetical protein
MRPFVTPSHFALAVVAVLTVTRPATAGDHVPFKGGWSGQTVSAAPLPDNPLVIAVVSSGEGEATHLGRFKMTSPHLSYLLTGFAEGEQNFTAANGDTLTAHFSGFFTPTPDGFLAADLRATITGGTGRFAGAAGGYTFSIVFDPATFQSMATIDGTISKTGH